MLTRLPWAAALSLVAAASASASASGSAWAETYNLPATPETVTWGNYDAAAKPKLIIKSGDTVVFRTLLTAPPVSPRRGFPMMRSSRP
jgi:hypothetical protein